MTHLKDRPWFTAGDVHQQVDVAGLNHGRSFRCVIRFQRQGNTDADLHA